jgi:hypothetical protein
MVGAVASTVCGLLLWRVNQPGSSVKQSLPAYVNKNLPPAMRR